MLNFFYFLVQNDFIVKMTFSNKGFVSKCDQICIFLRIWSHLLKKSLMKNFIFCAVCIQLTQRIPILQILATKMVKHFVPISEIH